MAGTTKIGEAHPLPDTGARRQGRYVLGELLGRGGMAEVFAGQAMGSHGFQKPVAIKRLLPELANDHVFVERLIGEAKLLISLQHGNIVSVLDLARDGDDVFLVMEFVDGPSLRQLMKSRGSRGLSLGVATYIIQAAAAGLEFAHARPGGAIIHADISPSNLLLTTSGEVRVADFGIARREGGSAGVVEGKWAYMAPEQARGEPLSPRSDVFALGVVLYELITGQHPFGKQVTEAEREAGLRVVPPRVLKPSITPGLDAICMRALAFEPHDRYSRMQQFSDAINEERFGNGWREGANDLGQAIREITPGSGNGSTGPKTQHTDRPLTIVTRSLISQSAPHRPSSPPHRNSSPPHRNSQPPPSIAVDQSLYQSPPDSGARTKMLDVQGTPVPQHLPQPMAQQPVPPLAPMPMPLMPHMVIPAMMPIPQAALQQMQRPESAPPPRLSHNLLPNGELVSVHGGNTMTGTGHLLIDSRNYKWTVAVFGVAALLGAIAAIAIQLAPNNDSSDPAPAPVVAAAQPAAQPPTPDMPAAVQQPATTPTEQKAAEPSAAQPQTQTPPAPAPAPAPTEQKAVEPVAPAPAVEQKPSTEQKPQAKDPVSALVEPKKRENRERDHEKKTVASRPSPASKRPISGEDGVILVKTEEGYFANIYVENMQTGQRIKHEVPEGRFQLPPGNYKVYLRNSTLGTQASCGTITLDAGKVVPLRADMEEGQCERR